jgi:crotonobetaine/carnitine-CoA ligase
MEVLASQLRTVPSMLARAAERFGSKTAFSFLDVHVNHRDLPALIARRAGALRAAGIGRGDRVALMCSNRSELLETFLACGWIGAVAVPINTASMGPQIEYYLTNSGAKLFVLEKSFVSRLRIDIPTWVLGESYAPSEEGATDGEGIRPQEPLAILYTSGTTGPAKGVICPHAQYYWWGHNTADILGVRAHDVLCTTLPLFHINALNTFAQACLTGAHAVFEERFSASEFWSTMRARRATVVYLLGAMVPILLSKEHANEKDHGVKIGLGPGVPVSALEAFKARTGITLLEGYGSTETNFVIATKPDSARRGVMGWLRPGFDARVADDGELLLKADDAMCFAAGYFGMPEKTADAWRDGWFHSGDRVVREADGAFRFIDRLKDSIRRRGENISSYEVEQVLLGHPDVAAVAVYPVRSDLAEDEVMAALVPRAGCATDAIGLAARLADFCATRLPYFAVPGFIDVMEDLPRTENGKVQKYRLRERGVTASAIRLPRATRT